MKWLYLCVGLLIGGSLIYCAGSKQTEYVIPADYGEQARERAIDWFEKGKALYKVNCAKCHGIYQPGKDSVTNFSKKQIDNYTAMFLKGDPKNHSVAARMSQEQLTYILTFLRLRRKV